MKERIRNRMLCIVFLIFCVRIAYGQAFDPDLPSPLKIRTLAIGSRLFELDAFGNNPTSVPLLMKDPDAYAAFMNSQTYTGISGSPGILNLYIHHISVELHKTNTASRFWKKYSLQAGLIASNRVEKGGMSVDHSGL